jgi:hypothetical protein
VPHGVEQKAQQPDGHCGGEVRDTLVVAAQLEIESKV